MVGLLLQHGADPMACGGLPLMEAIRNQHHQLVQLLVREGAGNTGAGPAGVSSPRGMPQVIQLSPPLLLTAPQQQRGGHGASSSAAGGAGQASGRGRGGAHSMPSRGTASGRGASAPGRGRGLAGRGASNAPAQGLLGHVQNEVVLNGFSSAQEAVQWLQSQPDQLAALLAQAHQQVGGGQAAGAPGSVVLFRLVGPSGH